MGWRVKKERRANPFSLKIEILEDRRLLSGMGLLSGVPALGAPAAAAPAAVVTPISNPSPAALPSVQNLVGTVGDVAAAAPISLLGDSVAVNATVGLGANASADRLGQFLSTAAPVSPGAALPPLPAATANDLLGLNLTAQVNLDTPVTALSTGIDLSANGGAGLGSAGTPATGGALLNTTLALDTQATVATQPLTAGTRLDTGLSAVVGDSGSSSGSTGGGLLNVGVQTGVGVTAGTGSSGTTVGVTVGGGGGVTIGGSSGGGGVTIGGGGGVTIGDPGPVSGGGAVTIGGGILTGSGGTGGGSNAGSGGGSGGGVILPPGTITTPNPGPAEVAAAANAGLTSAANLLSRPSTRQAIDLDAAALAPEAVLPAVGAEDVVNVPPEVVRLVREPRPTPVIESQPQGDGLAAAPFDLAAIDQSVQQVLGDVEEVGHTLRSLLAGTGWYPWLLGLTLGVVAYELNRRRRARKGLLSADQDQSMFPWLHPWAGLPVK